MRGASVLNECVCGQQICECREENCCVTCDLGSSYGNLSLRCARKWFAIWERKCKIEIVSFSCVFLRVFPFEFLLHREASFVLREYDVITLNSSSSKHAHFADFVALISCYFSDVPRFKCALLHYLDVFEFCVERPHMQIASIAQSNPTEAGCVWKNKIKNNHDISGIRWAGEALRFVIVFAQISKRQMVLRSILRRKRRNCDCGFDVANAA